MPHDRSLAGFGATLISLLLIFLAASATAQSVASDQLVRVDYGPGDGSRLGMFEQTAPGVWVERDGSDAVVFTFVELERTAETVAVFDASRGVTLTFDLQRSMVVYSDTTGATFDIYVIVESFGATAGRPSRTSGVSRSSSIDDGRPINHYTYLATHNAIASYAYGYNLQNSQRYSVTTQLDGGVRALEIDIVFDTPNDTEPAGVYICHCGQAPHSFSASELGRLQAFKDELDAQGKSEFLSLIPLPTWSNGGVFSRFHDVLEEVGDWLEEHPN
jgi:hypothetical protein